jgi:hypothetical protein
VNTNRLQTCNVFEPGEEAVRLWHFNVSGGQPSLKESLAGTPENPPSTKCAEKTWSSLWLQKLNVAWFPEDQVFLKVTQIPAGEPGELRSMIELQLEKLSPLPVAQIVWGFETIASQAKPPAPPAEPAPTADGDATPPPAAAAPQEAPLLTVVVIVVARARVEEFLGKLEARGYMADRLELPLLQRLLASKNDRDGVWLMPSTVAGQRFCLAGWWKDGILRNLNLLRVSSVDNWGGILTEQLTQLAWSGEMEGWLSGQLKCHLIADEETSKAWSPLLNAWSGEAVDVVAPLGSEALASLDARNIAAGANPANFLPDEYAVRYRQRFVDRLWMGGLGAVVALYLAFILISFLRLQVTNFQQYRVDSSVAKISGSYTNTQQMKARLKILQEQVNLRFAALECWKAATTYLPTDLTLTDLNFQQGKDFMIYGLAPPNQESQIIEYNQALKKYRIGDTNGPLLFSKVNTYNSSERPQGGQKMTAWNFKCEVQRTEVE